MSFFTDANEDSFSVPIDQAATGPKVGFLESFSVGYNEQVRGSAAYGIEDKMWNLDNEQTRALRKAGVENVPTLSPESMGFIPSQLPGPAAGVDTYLDVARFYTDGGTPEFANRLTEFDSRVTELREKYPELQLRTSQEMFETVKSEAQEYERRAQTDRRTWGGSAGMFVGGAVGALNPNTDPLNFITTPVGGAGKTILTRIAGQGAAQGFVEGINQITGVQEQRRLLGLSHGFGDAVARVGGAAIGGAALQGVGEAVAFGVRRWFKSTPADPAPAPGVTEKTAMPDTRQVPEAAIPADETLAAAKLTRNPETYVNYLHDASPLSGTRAGRARTLLDIDHVSQRLDEWSEVRPWELAPKTDTAPVKTQNDFKTPDFTAVAERAQVDEFARKADPETMDKYNALAKDKRSLRAEIETLTTDADAKVTQQLEEIDNKIYALQEQSNTKAGPGDRKVKKSVAKLEQQKAELVRNSSEPVEVKALRAELLKRDYKMRDLAPLVRRAYARANKRWDNTASERKAVYNMIRQGKSELGVEDPQVRSVLDNVARQLVDDAPILAEAYKVEGSIKADADAIEVAQAVIAKNEARVAEAVASYRNTLDEIIAVKKNGEVSISGQEFKLNLDKDKLFVPDEAGTGQREVTVRELLEENKELETELEAVSSCSIR